jgi:hypothetical protein
MESLDATVRVTRWQGPEAVPAPLQESASKVLDCLGTANRYAADRYVGPPPVVASLTAMSAAAKQLDTAYVEYRKRVDGPLAQRDEALSALDHEIDGVKADSHRWS